jgi:hypothetical protein
MPILNLNITNPQALELIRKIKTREIFIPLITWYKKYKWFLVFIAVLLILSMALVIGKKLSEKTPVPTFTPPDIETVIPTTSTIIKSDFSGLKEEIQNLNTDLPDPYIPVFDNAINLEETVP